jgi:hypothetical protein
MDNDAVALCAERVFAPQLLPQAGKFEPIPSFLSCGAHAVIPSAWSL